MTRMIIVDIEARGATPFTGEMTEFAAVALNSNMTAIDKTFYGLLIESTPDPVNPAIPFIAPDAKRYSELSVMKDFEKWLLSFNERVVAVSDNNSFDLGTWIYPYFDRNGIKNPFGFSSRRIGDFAAGLSNDWRNANKWKRFRKANHDHNPLNDALGNAEALVKLIAMSKKANGAKTDF